MSLQQVLRDKAARLQAERDKHDDSETRALLGDAAELARVCARFVEGKDVHGAFGAPGDWGYGTPIGAALAQHYTRKVSA